VGELIKIDARLTREIPDLYRTKRELRIVLGTYAWADRFRDQHEGENQNVYQFGDNESHFLYKIVPFQMSKFMRCAGMRSCTWGEIKTILVEINRHKADIKYGGWKEVKGEKTKVETEITLRDFPPVFVFTERVVGDPRREERIKSIGLAPYDGVVNGYFAAIAKAVIPHLDRLNIYELRLIFGIMARVRNNLKRVGEGQETFVFYLSREDLERMMGLPQDKRRLSNDLIVEMIYKFYDMGLIQDWNPTGLMPRPEYHRAINNVRRRIRAPKKRTRTRYQVAHKEGYLAFEIPLSKWTAKRDIDLVPVTEEERTVYERELPRALEAENE
jgi:hypothetical protein